MKSTASTSLWKPSNALAALGILLMKGSARLPLSWMLKFGSALGWLAWKLFPFRKRVALVNLRLCFPEMPEAERRDLARRHYQAMGMGAFELAAAWYKPWEKLRPISSISGLEHIEAVRSSGRGALLLTAHFTTMEMCGRILIEHQPFSCLYRKTNQPVLAREMVRQRKSHDCKLIHYDEVNELIRDLRAGDFVWYTPDQGRRIKYSSVLPFFGVPAVTNTATGRLVHMGRAAILPFFGYRKPDNTYHVEVWPPVEKFPSGDPETDAIEINRIFEQFVHKAPDQYFWLHKKFKHRGPDYPDVYKKS